MSEKDCKEYAAGRKDGGRDNDNCRENPVGFIVGGGSNKGKSGDSSSKSYQSGYKSGLRDD
jgi:hypothetical protein